MWMKNFVEYAKPSENQPILLILDNCSSHVDVSIIDYAKEHHIMLLSFPPHRSHRLQPLDVSVFGPLKTYKDQKMDTWMRENPGRSMSIHDIPSIVSYAFPLAFIPSNIAAGFRKTGIYPFDRNAIAADEYLQSYGTYREFLPDPEEMDPTKETVLVKSTSSPDTKLGVESLFGQQSRSITSPEQEDQTLSDVAGLLNVSTKSIWPLRHLEPRPSTSRSRSKVRSTIYTDTPVRNQSLSNKMKRPARSMTATPARKRKIRFFAKPKEQAEKYATTYSDSSDDDISLAAICDDDSKVSSEQSEISSVSSPSKRLQRSDLKEDDYILVRLTTKSILKFHIGQVLKVDEEEQEIHSKFMTRINSHQAGNTFP